MQDFSANILYQGPVDPDYRLLRGSDAQAVAEIIKENREEVEVLAGLENPTWESLMQPLERMENRLSLAVSPIAHLHSVLSNDEWREAYESILPVLSDYGADMAQHKGIYEAVKRLREDESFAGLSAVKKKLVLDTLEGFERAGVDLPEDKKARFKEIRLRLSELSTQFSNQVLDATNAWRLLLDDDDSRLLGLPASALALMKSLAEKEDKQGYLLTLDAPVLMPVLMYADDRALREQVYRAYNARASELSDEGRFDNSSVIKEIRNLRQELAALLGFEDYAQMVISGNRMAKKVEKVNAFLEELVERSKGQGLREMETLALFAKESLDLPTLAPWDVAYASEKLRQNRYALSQEDLRPYFPLQKVLQGLFDITERLFAARFSLVNDAHVWHEDVRVYDVFDGNSNLIARFTLDPFARDKKRGGAWMDSAVSRFLDQGKLQLPVAHLVCNFTPPVGDEDAYLTHDEVTTLFHEFGHGLHHMLTKVDEYSASGINGVEWDAVENPSQFMENFCYERECLRFMTAHKETGAPLPDDLFEKMLAAKGFQSAMAMLRQLEFAIFDMKTHSKERQDEDVLAILKEVRTKVAVTPDYPLNRFPMQFSHIFAGGYAAGYYSYKWAEVLSADCYALFEENGVLSPEIGARFRDEILAVGSSRSAMESFVAFRGREPEVDALLRHSAIS